MAPTVELLWWAGCPSHPQARAELREELAAAGLDEASLREVEITTDEEAEERGFVGSPTILVDGEDVDPDDGPAALTCRLYRLRDGRPSPVPDRAEVREALARARRSEIEED